MLQFKTRLIPFVLVLLVLLVSCTKSYDGPPDPGTPEPAPHEGVFNGEYGTLIFSGDGKTLKAEFSDAFSNEIGVESGEHECQYAFCWYNFGLCRWDVATVFDLYFVEEEKSVEFSIDFVEGISSDMISLTYIGEEGNETMDFKLQSK